MFYKLVSIIGIVFLLTGCVEEKNNIVEVKNKKVVKILDLSKTNKFKNTYKYPALVYSLQDSSMAFEVSGKITKFYYKEGEFVKKGSVIAKLDDTIYKANYNSAYTNLKQSELDYKRYKKLYESKSIAKRDLEGMKQTFDINKSKYKIEKKKLAETKLIAEFDGIMAKKLVNDFERISAKQVVLRLQDNSAYKIKFSAAENDILEVKEKINVENANKTVDFFVTVGKIKKKIPAKFLDISTTADEISRTFEVTLKIDLLKDKNILPGMTAHVEVVKKEKNIESLFIPLNALFSDSSKNSFVWLIDKKNRVHKVKVSTGRLEKDSIQIKEGLENSSKIVTSGIRFLSENDEIKEYKKIGN